MINKKSNYLKAPTNIRKLDNELLDTETGQMFSHVAKL